MVTFAATEHIADAEVVATFENERVLVSQNKFHAQSGRNAIVELGIYFHIELLCFAIFIVEVGEIVDVKIRCVIVANHET